MAEGSEPAEIKERLAYFDNINRYDLFLHNSGKKSGQIKSGDSSIAGKWDLMNYVSEEYYKIFKENRRHKDTEGRIAEFNSLLEEELYEKPRGRIVAKRVIRKGEKQETQYSKSQLITKREPVFEEPTEEELTEIEKELGLE